MCLFFVVVEANFIIMIIKKNVSDECMTGDCEFDFFLFGEINKVLDEIKKKMFMWERSINPHIIFILTCSQWCT